MRHFIITGASRGLGRALASVLADANTTLHLSARGDMAQIRDQLSRKGARVITYAFDLSRTDGIVLLMQRVFQDIDVEKATYLGLVNNAGMLDPIGPIGKHDSELYHKNLEVNFTAPAMMCHEFIKKTQNLNCTRRILNVSSGAARNPYHGWSHYCSTKAGLDMLTQCIHLEHGSQIGCAGFNPGRTDTAMQDAIRKQSTDDFEHVQSFIDAHTEGKLNDPKMVAAKMAALLTGDSYPSGKIVSVRDV